MVDDEAVVDRMVQVMVGAMCVMGLVVMVYVCKTEVPEWMKVIATWL